MASHPQRIPYAELHAHTNFSFLDGASAPDELVARAVELGLTGLAATDHDGLYGSVRFSGAAEEAGLHPVMGVEIGFGDAAVADPDHVVVPRPSGASPAATSGRRAAPARGRRRSPGPPPTGARPPPRPSRRGQGGPARGRRPGTRAAARPARPQPDRLAQPDPSPVAGQPGRDQGRAARPPRPPRGRPRGGRRPVGRARAARSGGGSWSATVPARERRPSVWPGSSARTASSSSCPTTCVPTTTGSSPSRSPSPATCACRSS